MKLWMRIALPVTTMVFTVSAHAQQWGTGYYGGMQACPYNYGSAAGSSDIQDEINEKQDAIKEAKAQLKAKKAELKTLERRNERNRSDVEQVVAADYTEQVFKHIDEGIKACQYKGFGGDAEGDQGGVAISNCGSEGQTEDISGFTVDQWRSVVDPTRAGNVRPSVCSSFKTNEKGRRTVPDCQKALVEYKKNSDKMSKLRYEMDALERDMDVMKDDIADLKKDYKEEQKEARKAALEGGDCPECGTRGSGYVFRKPETNWGNVVGNVAAGVLSIWGTRSATRMISNNNADLGFPTDPYMANGYGYGLGAGYIGQGIAEAIGGTPGYGQVAGGIGAGAFGCAGNNGGAYGMMGPYGGMNGNGMWGNPYGMGGMMNPYGGGMYAGGMGPWGYNGPGGMMGGYPGMGMMMSGGMMMNGGMMSPYGMMAGGMAPGMMMGGGMMMNGGMMSPYGMMSAGMMAPNMGMMINGGIGMMAGGMAPGMMMGGMSPYGMMAGGMAPGMMMGGGMMMNGGVGMMSPYGMMAGGMSPYGMMMNGGMGMAAGSLGQLQMQQQMMQMQMQQYQSYVQQQYQKQQVSASLQQEIYGLMYRLQQVQYGFGTDYLSGGLGSGSLGGGVLPAPGYGTGTTGGGVLPAPGYGTSTSTGGAILAPR